MEMEKLAQIFEAVRVIPLRPGDLLVYRASHRLSVPEIAAIYQELELRVGTSRILILDGGADVGVIRPEAEPEPPEEPPARRQTVGKAPGAIA